MEHLLLKAVSSTATDAGFFEAVISTASIDREKDIVDPAGMVRAIQKWIPTGKNIPLAWNHSTAPEHQIGYIDPKSARAQNGEVVVKGWIDQSTPVGAHAWRMVKAATLGFSFGFLTLASTPRKGGGKFLKEIDVFEATATGTPMNNDTRVLGWKAAVEVEEEEQDTLEVVSELLQDFLDTEDDDQDISTARDILARVQALIVAEQAEVPEKSLSELRATADALEFEHATRDVDIKRVEPEGTPEATPTEPDETTATLKQIVALLADEKADRERRRSLETLRSRADALEIAHTTANAPAKEPEPEPEAEAKSLADLFSDEELDACLAGEAQARIANSDLSPAVKEELTAKAQQILDAQKSVEVTDKEPSEVRSVDPLRARADALELEVLSKGQSLRKPPQSVEHAPPDLVPLRDLKQRMHDEIMTALQRGIGIEP